MLEFLVGVEPIIAHDAYFQVGKQFSELAVVCWQVVRIKEILALGKAPVLGLEKGLLYD